MLQPRYSLNVHFVSSIIFSVLCAAVLSTSFGQTHPTLDSTVICGYQGWFGTPSDGGYNGWGHWNTSANPGFEIYPDITEYPAAELYQTGYAALGDGRPAKLFSSYRASTMDLHFKWMQENGIDGAALQRFLNETTNATLKRARDSIAVHMMRAAEKYNRIFYIMYDGIDNNMTTLENDWQNTIVNALKLTASPRYAYMNGKPVVCLWGFGLSGYRDNATDALAAVNWFKSHGCYVIGGVPGGWRTGTGDSKAGYSQVYAAFDMISPWAVGSYKLDVEIDNAKTNRLIPEKAQLDAAGKAYQPVMFPGFAWSHLHNGPRNDFPRRQGNFLWRQFYNIKSLGIKYVYVAMFDEYDEGTAIMKGAADYFDTPTNVYFQTMSIDGVYLSSDFYLRLVGAAGRASKSKVPVTLTVPVPNSIGPIFFRSSFESNCDAQLTWVSSPDSPGGGFQNVTTPLCATATGTARSGSYAIRYNGTVSSTARALASFRAISAYAIPVDSQMTLTYAIYPQTALGRFAGIDLVMTDGTTLRSTAAVDTAAVSMNPATGRGTVGQWTTIKCAIGRWLAGKTIDRILVVYDHTGETGQFNGFIDNVTIQSTHAIAPTNVISKGSISRGPDSRISASYSGGAVWINGNSKGNMQSSMVRIYSCDGREIFKAYCIGSSVPVLLRAGVYFVRVENGWEPALVAKLAVGK
jgi:hypothetical protein